MTKREKVQLLAAAEDLASSAIMTFVNRDSSQTGQTQLRGWVWKSVRKLVNRGVDECKEEEPPRGLWRSLLWVSTPCEIDLERPQS